MWTESDKERRRQLRNAEEQATTVTTPGGVAVVANMFLRLIAQQNERIIDLLIENNDNPTFGGAR